MDKLREVVWDERAAMQLEAICRYIREFSPQNADSLKQSILEKAGEIPAHPEKYPIDKYRLQNSGNFRAFELHHVRVAYRISAGYILIVRVRNTYQEPTFY